MNPVIIDFVPRKTDLEDWRNKTKEQWMKIAENTNNLGTNSMHTSTLPYIQKIIEQMFRVTHPSLNFSEKEKAKVIDTYEHFQSIIGNFLGGNT